MNHKVLPFHSPFPFVRGREKQRKEKTLSYRRKHFEIHRNLFEKKELVKNLTFMKWKRKLNKMLKKSNEKKINEKIKKVQIIKREAPPILVPIIKGRTEGVLKGGNPPPIIF